MFQLLDYSLNGMHLPRVSGRGVMLNFFKLLGFFWEEGVGGGVALIKTEDEAFNFSGL